MEKTRYIKGATPTQRVAKGISAEKADPVRPEQLQEGYSLYNGRLKTLCRKIYW